MRTIIISYIILLYPILYYTLYYTLTLTEAEDIKKRWQEYTEELYKKDLHDPDNHDGVITDLSRGSLVPLHFLP